MTYRPRRGADSPDFEGRENAPTQPSYTYREAQTRRVDFSGFANGRPKPSRGQRKIRLNTRIPHHHISLGFGRPLPWSQPESLRSPLRAAGLRTR